MVSKFKERNIGLVYFINFEIFAIFKEGGGGVVWGRSCYKKVQQSFLKGSLDPPSQ